MALALALFVTPAAAQMENVVCAPAHAVEELLTLRLGMAITDGVPLHNGHMVEVWESPAGEIAIILHIPAPDTPVRCVLAELQAKPKGQGA